MAKADTLYDVANDDYYDGDYLDAERGFLHLRSFLKAAQLDTSAAYAKTTWKLADVYRRLRTHEKSLSFYSKAEQQYRKLPRYDKRELLLADIQMNKARVYSQMYEPQRAMRAYDSSLVVYREHYGEQHEVVANVIMNSALDLMKTGMYYDAEKRLLKAFDIFKVVSDSTSQDFNRIYSNLGYLYRKRGDFNRSLTYGKKALEIKLLHYDKDHPSVSKYHRNIGKALLALEREEEAIPYFQESYRIASVRLGPEHPGTIGALGELADAYAELGDFKQAMEIYDRTGRMLEKAHPSSHPYRVSYTFNVGMVHEDQGDYATAISAYQKAREDLFSAPEPPMILLADAERQIAQAYLKVGEPSYSLAYVDTALLRLAPELVSTEGAATTKLLVLQAESNVLKLLRIRAQAYAQRALEGDTLQSLNTIELAVEIVKTLRASFPTEEARHYLRDDAGDLYELGIQLAHRLYQSSGEVDFLKRALELSDAAKSGMLKDNFREEQARKLAGIPEEESMHVEQLANDLRDCRVAFGGKASPETTERLSSAAIAYQNAETELRRTYPKYAFLKGSDGPLDLQNIQNELGPKDAFIDYALIDSFCFITIIEKGGVAGFEVELPASFYGGISFVKRALQDPELNLVEAQQMTIYRLRSLHDILIGELLPELDGKEALLISPWGVLHQLPFATLVQKGNEEQDYRKLDYLINDFAISYRTNVSSLIQDAESNEQRVVSKEQLLGVAPEFGRTTGTSIADGTRQNQLASLRFTSIELANISKYFKSILLQGDRATEASFTRESVNYPMLHLASHGRLDNGEPLSSGIYFTPTEDSQFNDFLSAAEIYGLKLSADLAVLSACNTGAGRLQSGEGILSLAHAFRYAGCKSVVASSWLANDQSTADITSVFYAQLADGKPKNEALRAAKLQYLETADALSAHPFFWAGLTLRGDVGAIGQTSFNGWFLWGGLGVLVLGIFLFRRNG